eukprot:4024488-Amphidinium_carterae.1
MPQPIPSYLVALAVGNLECRDIGVVEWLRDLTVAMRQCHVRLSPTMSCGDPDISPHPRRPCGVGKTCRQLPIRGMFSLVT